MTADFKQRIVNYQENGDRLVIDEILYGTTFDFMNDPTRTHTQLSATKLLVTIDLPRHEYYISYRIRVLRDFALSAQRGARADIKSDDFSRILSIIAIDHRIDFNGEILSSDMWNNRYRITSDLISNLRRLQSKIEQELHSDEYYYFCKYLDMYEPIATKLELDFDEAERQVDANILIALERALSYVDASKTDKEIVKYTNKAFSTRFGELELARKGMQRIVRVNSRGVKSNLHISKRFPTDNYTAILPQLTADNFHNLTRGQADLVSRLCQIVEIDRANDDLTGYSCQNNGLAIIKRNYAAEKLGETTTKVRKSLSRMAKSVTK